MCWKLILKVQQLQSCKYCKVSGANTKPNMASVYCKSRFYLLQAISQKKLFSHLIKGNIVRSCNDWAVTPRCVFPSSNLDQVLGDTDLFSIKRRGPWEVNWPRCESHGKRPPRRLQMAWKKANLSNLGHKVFLRTFLTSHVCLHFEWKQKQKLRDCFAVAWDVTRPRSGAVVWKHLSLRKIR